LMPGAPGPGARREARSGPPRRTRSRAPGRTSAQEGAEGVWLDGAGSGQRTEEPEAATAESAVAGTTAPGEPPPRRLPPPQIRSSQDPVPTVAEDGSPVMRYPFELRARGNRVRMSASVEVMANDGGQVETEPPAGAVLATVRSWVDPAGRVHSVPSIEI